MPHTQAIAKHVTGGDSVALREMANQLDRCDLNGVDGRRKAVLPFFSLL